MESELDRARRKLLEFCNGIANWDEWNWVEDDDPEVDFRRMQELIREWKMAEILDTARNIA